MRREWAVALRDGAQVSAQIQPESVRPNQALERTGGQPAHHGRASVAAGRSTLGR
jgi:hypothetical protein